MQWIWIWTSTMSVKSIEHTPVESKKDYWKQSISKLNFTPTGRDFSNIY